MNFSQYLLTGNPRRLVDPQNLGGFCGEHDEVGGSIPLISEHLSGLSRQTKPSFALAQSLLRSLALGHIDTTPDVTDKRAMLNKTRDSDV